MVILHKRKLPLSPHAGPWPHTHRLDRATSKSKGSRAQGWRKMATARVAKVKVKAKVFLGIITLVLAAVYTYTFIFTITSTASKSAVRHEEKGSLTEADDNYVQQPLPTSYQCALVWLRVPKTASTTVIRRFMTPFVRAANFTSTGIEPSTCITNAGGCADIWQQQQQQQQQANNMEEDHGGISSRIDSGSGGDSQRCLPSLNDEEYTTRCWEYDSTQSTVTRKNNLTSMPVRFDAHPKLHTHVALDPSLFGWILPRSPMVFSTFRQPVDRLLSSFHFGMRVGGDRPGQLKRCTLPGEVNSNQWQNRVVAARAAVTLQNNYTLYQQALREYLESCRDIVSNVYVQFLDPVTNDVNIAVRLLEKFVIVGLQGDIDESLQRWAKIAVWSCRDHPYINRIRKDLLTEPKHVGTHFRQSATLMELKGDGVDENEAINGTAELASPTLNELDADLQQLIRALTVDDEVIFQRAEELYAEQGHWFD